MDESFRRNTFEWSIDSEPIRQTATSKNCMYLENNNNIYLDKFIFFHSNADFSNEKVRKNFYLQKCAENRWYEKNLFHCSYPSQKSGIGNIPSGAAKRERIMWSDQFLTIPMYQYRHLFLIVPMKQPKKSRKRRIGSRNIRNIMLLWMTRIAFSVALQVITFIFLVFVSMYPVHEISLKKTKKIINRSRIFSFCNRTERKHNHFRYWDIAGHMWLGKDTYLNAQLHQGLWYGDIFKEMLSTLVNFKLHPLDG